MAGREEQTKEFNAARVTVTCAFAKPLRLAPVLRALAEAGAVPDDLPREVQPSTQRRVMVVEDNQECRMLFAEYLRAKEFEVLEVSSGEEALLHVSEFRPHFVLLDIMMPGMSGVEALPQIKALSKETCIVMVSALDHLETARQTLPMGAADYVPKPVDFQYLDWVLQRPIS